MSLIIYRVKLLETSAKDDINIKEIFRNFLTLSKMLPKEEDSGGLKRRSSAYVSATKGKNRLASPAPERSSGAEGASTSLSKPRSRSLIRRASRKTKQQIRDAQSTSSEDCTVS